MINIHDTVNPNFHLLNNPLALHQINQISPFPHISPSPLNSNYINTNIIQDKNEFEFHFISDEQADKQSDKQSDKHSQSPIRHKKENTLDKLTKAFLSFCREQKNEKININPIIKKYVNKKRRIYDITNVLQGIGFIKKLDGNEIKWEQNYPKSNSEKKIIPGKEQENNDKIKMDLIELIEENKSQNVKLKLFEDEFQKILDDKIEKYGFITKDDICDLSRKTNLNFV